MIGDSVGSKNEFTEHFHSDKEVEDILKMPGGGPFNLLPGQITDDSELALCLLRALSEMKEWDADMIAFWYGKWINSNPFDIGNTTKNALGPL